MFENMSFLSLLEKGGIVVIVLILCSILSLAVFFERLKTFYGVRMKLIEEVKKKVSNMVLAGKISEAVTFCDNYVVKFMFFKVPCPLNNVFKAILFSYKKDKQELSEIAMRAVDKEMVGLEKFLGILGTIGNISLYIGLVGTVMGIMHAFKSMSIESAVGPSVVAGGIAEALINTIAGLIVAITSVVFYNAFTRQIKKLLVTFEDSAAEIIDIIKK
ncbi:MAG: MotA/TolQ/ExbB proton channel family protein [Candidatus Firestonebacteria bacterium]|nr:MotA/TolQ/ExbB proton channel family protein [Candidatus Firestonebacteria bacterium]